MDRANPLRLRTCGEVPSMMANGSDFGQPPPAPATGRTSSGLAAGGSPGHALVVGPPPLPDASPSDQQLGEDGYKQGSDL